MTIPGAELITQISHRERFSLAFDGKCQIIKHLLQRGAGGYALQDGSLVSPGTKILLLVAPHRHCRILKHLWMIG